MTYEQDLQRLQTRNREITYLLKLAERHPKTLNVSVISEERADFERVLLSELDADIAERLKNEIIGFLKQQLHRGTRAELETMQLIREKSLPQHEQRETLVCIYNHNRNANTYNV